MNYSVKKLWHCTRENFCFECDNKKCIHHGSKRADCPKRRCDMEAMDCDNCSFLNDIISGKIEVN